jgi:hypothetical protein
VARVVHASEVVKHVGEVPRARRLAQAHADVPAGLDGLREEPGGVLEVSEPLADLPQLAQSAADAGRAPEAAPRPGPAFLFSLLPRLRQDRAALPHRP